jgi:hypothetical protein
MPLGPETIEKIISSDTISIVFINPRFDAQDRVRQKYYKRLSLPFLPCQDLNDTVFKSVISNFKAEFCANVVLTNFKRRNH